MPFKTFQWAGDYLDLVDQEPDPELRQTDDNSFVILESFCYLVAPPDPEEGKVYVIPGADMPVDATTRQTTTVPGVEPVRTVVVLVAFLIINGTGWRAGVDLTGGWLLPTALLAAAVLIPLVFAWPSSFKLSWSPFTLLFVAAVLFFLGLFWGIAVDPKLRMWL